jgi:hypothetical protein
MEDSSHIYTDICPFLNSNNFPYRFLIEVFSSKQHIFQYLINRKLPRLIDPRKDEKINEYIKDHYNQHIALLSLAGFEHEINEILQIKHHSHEIRTSIKIENALLDIFPFEEQTRAPITITVKYFENLKWIPQDYEPRYSMFFSVNSDSKTIFRFNDRSTIIHATSISMNKIIPFLALATGIDPQIANLVDEKMISNDLHKYFYEPNFKFVYILRTYPAILPRQRGFIKKNEAIRIPKSKRKEPLLQYIVPSTQAAIEYFDEVYKLDNIIFGFVSESNIIYIFSNEEIHNFFSFFSCDEIKLNTKIRIEAKIETIRK